MKKTILLLALLSLIVLMTSCSKGEEVTISKYFEAMKMNDKDTMASMAMEPRGIEFKKYEVVSITEPVSIELELPALEKKKLELEDAKKKQIDVAMDKKYAVEDLQDELAETRRRDKKAELEKKIEEAQVEQAVETEKVKTIMGQINKIKKAISSEKALIKASTTISDNYELFTGETITSQATVKVTLSDGNTQDYIFLLRKNNLTMNEKAHNGRIVIIKIATPDELEAEKKAAAEEEAAMKDMAPAATEEAAPATEGETPAATEEGEGAAQEESSEG